MMSDPTGTAGHQAPSLHAYPERGITLIIVLILLVTVTILGIGGARIALLGERSTRFDRDYQVAWQAAEAALVDAEYDIAGPNSGGANRIALFNGDPNVFVDNCGQSGSSRGLCKPAANEACAPPTTSADPIWTTADFAATAGTARTARFGEFTGRDFPSGSGLRPAQSPRYIIECVEDIRPGNDASAKQVPPPVIYRITAVGFGPNVNVQVMLQSSYSK